MTIDVDKELDAIFRDDAPSAAEMPGSASPEAGPGSGDDHRRDDGGGGGGGGHTRMARWAEKYDVRNSWQVIAGAILIPLGVVFILLAWYGAAHARVVQQQIPYLVSGSFVGLGCMVVGGLLFFGHWLYRIYDQADLHHEEQQRVLESIAAALLAQREGVGAAVVGSPVGAGAEGAPAASGAGTSTYYATSSGTVYHRADCAVIAHHPEDLRVLGPAAIVGMRPCQICIPGSA